MLLEKKIITKKFSSTFFLEDYYDILSRQKPLATLSPKPFGHV
jgi:hypothetical protein